MTVPPSSGGAWGGVTNSIPDASAPGFQDALEEFEDDGLDFDAAQRVPSFPGRVFRPNGQEYRPRLVSGIQDVALLRHARARKDHTLFYGPPGTGKTALIEAAFFMDAIKDTPATEADGDTADEYVHLGFETLICGVDTNEGDFFGGYIQDPVSGAFEWNDGPLLRALKYGIPFFADEIFLCDSRVLSSTLYPLMDGRSFLTVPMNPRLGRIPVRDGFFVIAAGNPNVPGANYSDALRSRFAHQIEVESDWALCRSMKVPANIVQVAKRLDKDRKEGVLSWSPQTRDLLNYQQTRANISESFALADLLGACPPEDRPLVRDELEKKFRTTIAPLALGAPAPVVEMPA